MTKQCFC